MVRLKRLLYFTHFALSVPFAIMFLLDSPQIHPTYKITLWRKIALGFTMFLNNIRIPSGSSFAGHLAMALKILETPPDVKGDILECGTWKGASAANLSLVCKLVGRRLLVFDSFEGLPEGDPRDREARWYKKGDYKGAFDEVTTNVQKYGALDVCEFHKGWFHNTLPLLDTPILLAWLDVDLEASLDICVKHIWPHLTDGGYIFTDECGGTDYVALFYSEKWWQRHFGRTPPGLIGAGTGLCLGNYYVGPWSDRADYPLQHAGTAGYTRKSMSGHWNYYPDEQSTEQ